MSQISLTGPNRINRSYRFADRDLFLIQDGPNFVYVLEEDIVKELHRNCIESYLYRGNPVKVVEVLANNGSCLRFHCEYCDDTVYYLFIYLISEARPDYLPADGDGLNLPSFPVRESLQEPTMFPCDEQEFFDSLDLTLLPDLSRLPLDLLPEDERLIDQYLLDWVDSCLSDSIT